MRFVLQSDRQVVNIQNLYLSQNSLFKSGWICLHNFTYIISIMNFHKRSASHALNTSRQRIHQVTSIKRNQPNYYQLELNLFPSRDVFPAGRSIPKKFLLLKQKNRNKCGTGKTRKIIKMVK